MDWYYAIDPATGRQYPGPCSRCKMVTCHPAIYPIESLPVCWECLTLEEQLRYSEPGTVSLLLKGMGIDG